MGEGDGRNEAEFSPPFLTGRLNLVYRTPFRQNTALFYEATGVKGGRQCGERSSAVCIGVEIRRAPPGLLNVLKLIPGRENERVAVGTANIKFPRILAASIHTPSNPLHLVFVRHSPSLSRG
ncbi:hypothetical protein T03_10966 [Trichinella britovi]|nr:hypothetical protein T03_10966 [Trichinella britovi]